MWRWVVWHHSLAMVQWSKYWGHTAFVHTHSHTHTRCYTTEMQSPISKFWIYKLDIHIYSILSSKYFCRCPRGSYLEWDIAVCSVCDYDYDGALQYNNTSQRWQTDRLADPDTQQKNNYHKVNIILWNNFVDIYSLQLHRSIEHL